MALTILVIDALGVCWRGGKRAVDVILRFSVGSFNLIRVHSCLHWSSGVLTQAINIPYFCLQFVRSVVLAGDKGTKSSSREVNRRSLDTSLSSRKLIDQT
jgi:hypothetical protein